MTYTMMGLTNCAHLTRIIIAILTRHTRNIGAGNSFGWWSSRDELLVLVLVPRVLINVVGIRG